MIYKKAQVAVFVIFAIIIVSLVIVYFLFFQKQGTSIISTGEFNAQEYVSQCVRDRLSEGVDKSLPQGGIFNPRDYRQYQGKKIPYLCKNINYYDACINQYPRYIVTLQDELHNYLGSRIDGCFNSLKAELEKRKYSIKDDNNKNFEVVLEPDFVEVKMQRKISFNKDASSTSLDDFSSKLRSPLYDLSLVTQNVVSQEARFCYFETAGFNLLYPKTDVRRATLSDYTRIYNIKDKASGKQLNMAIRGCAIPAGF